MQADGNGRHGATATRWPQPTGLHISSLLSKQAGNAVGQREAILDLPFTHSLPSRALPDGFDTSAASFPQLAGCAAVAFVRTTSRPPKWIKPLVDEAPAGGGGLHEIKYDSSRMHGPQDNGKVKLLTHTDLDRSHLPNRSNSGGRLNGYILGGQSQKS